jgi:predicted outer membrane repeat protein
MRLLSRLTLALFLAITFSLALTPAQAATFSVCTLGELTTAITTANANTQADVIDFNCSTTLNFTSQISILNDGAGNGITINANGNAVTFDRVGAPTQFFIVGSGGNLTVNGLTFQNGLSTISGGAILNNGTLTINDIDFINNSSPSDSGGAIANNGTLTINDSSFTGNSSWLNGGAITNTSSLTINNSIFRGNSTSNAGGAFFSNVTGIVVINNSTFIDNVGGNGSAIRSGNIASSQNSHYENNTCTGISIVVITDNGGNTVTNATGCPGSAPIALDVSALACNGDNAEFTINAGDGNFDITGTGAGLPLNDVPAGLVTLTGAGAWTNITITERLGERDFINLGGILCPEAVIIPPSEPIAPTATVLGCALDSTDGVDIANAPDNTYCRILMKNGGVVSYSGAVPADLISLGVILAVDVYRLEGGATQNTFPDYSRVCLSGTGRLFYMDGRNAPRVSVEMPTEQVDGLTCAWIPAPGTVILTN